MLPWRPELLLQGAQGGAANETRGGPDQPKIASEFGERRLVRGVDANLECEPRIVLAPRLHRDRPRDFHEVELVERRKRSGIADVNERNRQLPDLADRADRDLSRGIVDQDLEARLLGAGDQRVDGERALLGPVPRQARRQLAQCEQRACDGGMPNATMAHELPDRLRRGGQVDMIDFQQAGGGQQAVKGAHEGAPQQAVYPNLRGHTSRAKNAVGA